MKKIDRRNKLSTHYAKKFKLLEKQRFESEQKLKIALSAMKSAVGFEPFNSLNPYPLSEALEKLKQQTGDRK